MASIKDIRRRISSVKSTQQITKAMKLVAASRLRRAQQAIVSARPYTEKLEALTSRVLGELVAALPASVQESPGASLAKLHPLLQSRVFGEGGRKKRVHLLVISSDRGLCGAYNTNASKFGLRRAKELLADDGVDLKVSFVGKKAFDYFSRRGVVGELVPDFWSGKFNSVKADSMAKGYIEKFFSQELDELEVVFTEFRSAISQVAQSKVLLPFDVTKVLSNLEAIKNRAPAESEGSLFGTANSPFIYEPGKQQILETVLPALLRSQVYRLFAESLASEFGARMAAMDNATRNAGDMISDLTLQANRIRQAAITTELMEIIGGAEALKG